MPVKRRKLRSGSLKKSEDLLFTKEESPVFFIKTSDSLLLKFLLIVWENYKHYVSLVMLLSCCIAFR
ncbi:TPA: hypothetical protein DD394_08250 [bacterium UBP9_UBA11836]|nr:hypothetical protein [bacterium UBP9_UBA11836]